MMILKILSMLVVCAALIGCSTIAPIPEDIANHPFGTESIRVGMSKNEVESKWGKPDEVKTIEDKEKWKGSREVWVYHANYSAIPVDAGYFSKTKKLYFDGDNLTNISE
jgi:outer membrane protein assembly factor BamE (lipoprotein component of BamABCDE complex)